MAYQECVNGHVDIWLDMDDKPEGHYISYVDHEFENGEFADYTEYYNTYRERFNTRVNYNDSKVDPTLQYWCDRAQAVFNQRVFPGMPDNFEDTAEYEKYLDTRKECFEECSLAYNLDNGVQGKIVSAGFYSSPGSRQISNPDRIRGTLNMYSNIFRYWFGFHRRRRCYCSYARWSILGCFILFDVVDTRSWFRFWNFGRFHHSNV